MNALMKVEEGILDDVLGQGFVLGDEKGGPNRPHLVAAHQFSNPPMSPPFMRRTASWSSRATPGMVARIGNTLRRAERLGGCRRGSSYGGLSGLAKGQAPEAALSGLFWSYPSRGVEGSAAEEGAHFARVGVVRVCRRPGLLDSAHYHE